MHRELITAGQERLEIPVEVNNNGSSEVTDDSEHVSYSHWTGKAVAM